MKQRAILLMLGLAVVPLLSGCVAAVVPVAAAGAIARKQIAKKEAKVEEPKLETAVAAQVLPAPAPPPIAAPPVALAVAPPPPPVGTLEAPPAIEAISPSAPMQPISGAYAPFVKHALAKANMRVAGGAVGSVVLINGLDVQDPKFADCGARPLAVMIDLDEAAEASASARDAVEAPALAQGLAQLRESTIAIVWVSDKRTTESGALREALQARGLIDPETDLLAVTQSAKDRKQLRRLDIAARYCVIAMAGDRRSDFDELYDYLRDPDLALSLDKLWDAGWFLVSSPLSANPPETTQAKKDDHALDPR